MVTIDFRFFQAMREKLSLPFNPTETDELGSPFYTQENLNILYNSTNLLQSDYCSEDFRKSFTLFVQSNPENFKKEVVLRAKAYESGELHTALEKMLKDFGTLKQAIEYADSISEVATDTDGVETKRVLFTKTETTRLSIDYEYFIIELSTLYEIKDIYLGSKEIENYYGTWLSDKKGYHLDEWKNLVKNSMIFCKSPITLENLILQIGKLDTAQNLLENLLNLGWDNPVSEFMELPPREKEFFKEIIEYKGFEGLNLVFQATFSSAQKKKFFNREGKDFTVSAENVDQLFNELSDFVAFIDYSNISLEAAEYSGFDVESLKKLVKKFKVPMDILERLVTEEFPSFNLEEDRLVEEIGSAFKSTTGAAGAGSSELKFNIEVEYEKPGVDYTPIKKTTTKGKDYIEYKAKPKKTFSVELLSKTNPLALFIGKMTKSCQFYTGDSSKQAVIPVYTDPNAGLIVVRDLRDGGKIKAASFAWLTQNEEGEVDGVVLDSFEHLPEMGKVFVPLITEFSQRLSESGLKLYIGSSGKTPKLFVYKDGVSLAAEIIPHGTPLSEDFEPYYDSKSVYCIDPDAKYSVASVGVDYENYTTAVINGLSSEEALEFKALFSTIYEGHIKYIIDYCIGNKLDFYRSFRGLAPILNGVRGDSLREIDKILSILQCEENYEKLAIFQTGNYFSSENFDKFVDSVKSLSVDQIKIIISVKNLSTFFYSNPDSLEILSSLTMNDSIKLKYFESEYLYIGNVSTYLNNLRKIDVDQVKIISSIPQLKSIVVNDPVNFLAVSVDQIKIIISVKNLSTFFYSNPDSLEILSSLTMNDSIKLKYFESEYLYIGNVSTYLNNLRKIDVDQVKIISSIPQLKSIVVNDPVNFLAVLADTILAEDIEKLQILPDLPISESTYKDIIENLRILTLEQCSIISSLRLANMLIFSNEVFSTNLCKILGLTPEQMTYFQGVNIVLYSFSQFENILKLSKIISLEKLNEIFGHKISNFNSLPTENVEGLLKIFDELDAKDIENLKTYESASFRLACSNKSILQLVGILREYSERISDVRKIIKDSQEDNFDIFTKEYIAEKLTILDSEVVEVDGAEAACAASSLQTDTHKSFGDLEFLDEECLDHFSLTLGDSASGYAGDA